ncbi:hypothetical protein IFM89_030997 [Coptis chinensis]|uniref:KIB1-4 beta-propeller domain-containing protein n=1 Tax=Coptis chinensis TaxID=261450 RepID=A0A835H6E8_9MAGN|nr:hypothetical protein IFM89_030997 [Coptis chinensis]
MPMACSGGVDWSEIPEDILISIAKQLHSLIDYFHERCVGSTGNWLITVNKELELHIFNPFSRTALRLPSQSTLPYQFSNVDGDYSQEDLRDQFLAKVVLSSTPKFSDNLLEDLDSVVAIVIYAALKKLAIARLGDESWSPVKPRFPATSAINDDHALEYHGTGTEGGLDIGVFNLEDGTIKPHYTGIATSLYTPPLWVIPKSLC